MEYHTPSAATPLPLEGPFGYKSFLSLKNLTIKRYSIIVTFIFWW